MTTAILGRIFISVDMDFKNHTRINDSDISLKRDVDNFDKRVTRPINGIVINAENIPSGAECLIHHNATHPTYEIFDYKEISGEYISGNERYFSIPVTECYAWRANGEWNPCEGFEFGLRIFKPYGGSLSGILPTQIKNKLFITSGELKNKVVITKAACDYEMVYQDKNGKENRLIRIRHFNEPQNIRQEIIAIDTNATKEVENNKLLIGLLSSNCKTLN